MEYALAGWSGVNRKELPVEPAEYQQIYEAKSKLVDALRIEEKYNMVLENYRDFEQYLLEATLRYMLFSEAAWPRLVAIIYEAARRVQNLLSTSRLYLDQVRHDLSAMYGSGSANALAFVSATNKEYDDRLGYRAMEALRNYMQHRSLSLGRVLLGGERRQLPHGEFGITTIQLRHQRRSSAGRTPPSSRLSTPGYVFRRLRSRT